MMLVSTVLALSKVERPFHSLGARQLCPVGDEVSSVVDASRDLGDRRANGGW